MKTLIDIVIIGLGNPLLCDDTAGLKVIDIAQKRFAASFPTVRFESCYAGGFDLLDALSGSSKAILVDSVRTGVLKPGECVTIRPEEIFRTGQDRLEDSHGIELPAVLALGRNCGMTLPEEIVIIGIEGTDFEQWSEAPTDAVSRGIEKAVQLLEKRLNIWLKPVSDLCTKKRESVSENRLNEPVLSTVEACRRQNITDPAQPAGKETT